MDDRSLRVTTLLWIWRRGIFVILISSLVCLTGNRPVRATTISYCQQSQQARQQKAALLQAALKGDVAAKSGYEELISQQGDELQQCRSTNWPQIQAIWLRLYPCDIRPGILERILDDIVNRGYNEVYLDVFSDGQVLLPAADNPTVWPSVLRVSGAENTDLLAQVIQKSHRRGLKVYAWMFLMNFGYSYSEKPDRQGVLAHNGKEQTSLDVIEDGSQVFADPYNLQAKQDYYQLLQTVLQRRPDGVLFDYVRYPRGSGNDSIVSKVKDLWIYGDAAQQALYRRAQNRQGLELIRRFVTKGYITAQDVQTVAQLYPDEGEPQWQGRTVPPSPPATDPAPTPAQAAAAAQPLLQWQLWQLCVAHALQGILDFLAMVTTPVQQQGIPAGVVFFPEGNQAIGQGYDSRLQPWDRFPVSLEWHPMAYADCGDTSCIVAEVQRVFKYAPQGAQISPVIAGVWGQPINNRPSLEMQMQAIHQALPQVQSISHFAFSWQEPDWENQRKYCQLQFVNRLQESERIP